MSSTSPDPAWPAVRALFAAASALPAGERTRLLDKECAHDPDLRRHVESLLAHLDAPAHVVARPEAAFRHWTRTGVVALDPGAPAGIYTIVSVLGEGGSARVYRARPPGPQGHVALKVFGRGALGPEVVRRFEREAEILQKLRHPGIARILSWGLLADGRPYLAMELVEGRRINRAARELDIPGRVALFLRVCEAVGFAHHKGVIHRDLKPSNVIVRTGPDGVQRPVVLDFGVARAIDPASLAIEAGAGARVVGTIAYMSPEQAAGESDDADARSDIFSLGVILYELIAGRTPMGDHDQPTAEALEAARRAQWPSVLEFKPDAPPALVYVIEKAMERDPMRRYQSVHALTEDLAQAVKAGASGPRPANPAPARSGWFSRFRRRDR